MSFFQKSSFWIFLDTLVCYIAAINNFLKSFSWLDIRQLIEALSGGITPYILIFYFVTQPECRVYVQINNASNCTEVFEIARALHWCLAWLFDSSCFLISLISVWHFGFRGSVKGKILRANISIHRNIWRRFCFRTDAKISSWKAFRCKQPLFNPQLL